MKRTERFRTLLAKQKEKDIKELDHRYLLFDMILDAFDQEFEAKKLQNHSKKKPNESVKI